MDQNKNNQNKNSRYGDVYHIEDDSASPRKTYSRDDSQVSTLKMAGERLSQINQHPLARSIKNSVVRATCEAILKYLDDNDHK